MIGRRPPPTTSKSHRHGSGFHGSPVEPRMRSDERSCARTGLVAVSHQRANERRRDAEDCDAGAARPAPRGDRGRGSRARRRRAPSCRRAASAEHLPGPHHPAHVGDPVHRLAVMHVEAVHHVLRGLDREAAMRMHRALGPAGRAGGVDDHQRIFGAGPLGRARRRVARPPDSFHQRSRGPIATSCADAATTTITCSTDGAAATAASATVFIRTTWPRRQKPSAVIRHLGARVLQPRGHGVRAVAGEERQHDAADLDRWRRRRRRSPGTSA